MNGKELFNIGTKRVTHVLLNYNILADSLLIQHTLKDDNNHLMQTFFGIVNLGLNPLI